MSHKIFEVYRKCVRKARYSTLRSANASAVRMQYKYPEERKLFVAYKCDNCGMFHVGRTKAREFLRNVFNFPDGWERAR